MVSLPPISSHMFVEHHLTLTCMLGKIRIKTVGEVEIFFSNGRALRRTVAVTGIWARQSRLSDVHIETTESSSSELTRPRKKKEANKKKKRKQGNFNSYEDCGRYKTRKGADRILELDCFKPCRNDSLWNPIVDPHRAFGILAVWHCVYIRPRRGLKSDLVSLNGYKKNISWNI